MNRRKQGFGAPVHEWLQKDLRELFGDILLSPNNSNSGLFDHGEIEKLWNKYSSNSLHVDLSERLWSIFSYEMWNLVYKTV